mgnify:CR=1 FL=1
MPLLNLHEASKIERILDSLSLLVNSFFTKKRLFESKKSLPSVNFFSCCRLQKPSPTLFRRFEFGLEHSTVKHNITGSDTTPILLFVPLGQPSFDLAVHDALQKGRGQILTDAVVTDTTRWFVLFGWNRIEISGNVVDLQ